MLKRAQRGMNSGKEAHLVAVSLEPTRETSLSSSIVALPGLGISKGRAIYWI